MAALAEGPGGSPPYFGYKRRNHRKKNSQQGQQNKTASPKPPTHTLTKGQDPPLLTVKEWANLAFQWLFGFRTIFCQQCEKNRNTVVTLCENSLTEQTEKRHISVSQGMLQCPLAFCWWSPRLFISVFRWRHSCSFLQTHCEIKWNWTRNSS